MILQLLVFYFVPALIVWTYVYLYFKGKLSWLIPLDDKSSPNLFELYCVIVPFWNIMICLGIVAFVLGEVFKIKVDKKKLINKFFRVSAVVFFLSFMSCAPNPKPIEKYKGWVLVEKEIPYIFQKTYEDRILIKNKDSIKMVDVLLFDTQNLKIGDTIK